MMVEHNEGHPTEVRHILGRLEAADQPEGDLGVWEYFLLNT